MMELSLVSPWTRVDDVCVSPFSFLSFSFRTNWARMESIEKGKKYIEFNVVKSPISQVKWKEWNLIREQLDTLADGKGAKVSVLMLEERVRGRPSWIALSLTNWLWPLNHILGLFLHILGCCLSRPPFSSPPNLVCWQKFSHRDSHKIQIREKIGRTKRKH